MVITHSSACWHIIIIIIIKVLCSISTDVMSRETSNVFSAGFHFNCSVLKGNLRPEEALQSLTIYEGNFSRLKDEREKCARAKEALELTDTGVFSGSEERVQVGCRQ